MAKVSCLQADCITKVSLYNKLHKTAWLYTAFIFRPPFLKGEVMATLVGTQGVVRIDASPDNWMCVPLDFFTSDEPASCSLA